MKITGRQLPATTFPATRTSNPSPDSDLKASHKLTRRRARNPSLNRLRKTGPLVGRRSRPETPLLKWKVEDRDKNVSVEEEQNEKPEGSRRGRRKSSRVVSARKLAAGLWRLQSPDAVAGGGETRDHAGSQPGAGHVGISFSCPRAGKVHGAEVKDLLESPRSVSGIVNGYFRKFEPSFQFSNSAMEGATKWDPVCVETLDEVREIYSHMKRLDQQVSAVAVVSALEAELEQARLRIQELETERRSSKNKLEHFLRKVSEEKASWRSREHEKIRAFIADIKAELNRERKNRQRMEILNSKLVNELADAKLSAKKFVQDYEKERKARELIEEVCDELAKEIGEDKAELEELKRESAKFREEVEEERKMLQMAEVWREERVQMKLVDAKVALEEKYSQMNRLVADLDAFLRSKSANPDVKEIREAELFRQSAASVNIQEIKEFSYDPPNPDDIFSIFEDVNFGENNEREIEQCVVYSPASPASKVHTVSPEMAVINKDNIQKHSHTFTGQIADIEEEDESGWETVSHIEDQGSSYSPEGSSAPSVNRNRRYSNVSGSGTEWEEHVYEETPMTEISEVCSVPTKNLKKVSSIARLWKSCPSNGDNYKVISVEGMKGRLSNGRLSNEAIMSLDHGSEKGEVSPPELVEQWSSPDSGNPHITRGMRGCIEWPRGAQKNSLKAKLLEARMESQKVQLRHVLKQKI